ncbi:utrophin [Salmo salar]|uniref:Utrophin n=1 Tax=Salmo salar TaxID=8030 RepID=A0ABM3CZN9_SALSA|nr:utrophin-like [Salmo salar]
MCYVKTLLEELDDISLSVDSVRDQATLMTSRGPACRDVVEPKLAKLNLNFHMVSQCIKAAMEMRMLRVRQVEISMDSSSLYSFTETQRQDLTGEVRDVLSLSLHTLYI